eukprot:SAG31_NODE_7887_length_1573_cov_1.139756_1_plen_31_part_10
MPAVVAFAALRSYRSRYRYYPMPAAEWAISA